MTLIRKILNRALIPFLGIFILYLFYRSWLVVFSLPALIIFSLKYCRKEELEKYREILNLQFKDALVSMTAALRVGYSVEKAVGEVTREMTIMYGRDAPISKEFTAISNQIGLGVTVEKAFRDFAEESGVEDIETFASVFSIAKQTGGDLVEIIGKSASDIAAKADTMNEIKVLTSAKNLEQKMMAAMPPAIILYVNLTSGGILDPLYGNLTGIVVMTVCFALYLFAFFLGKRLTRIEV